LLDSNRKQEDHGAMTVAAEANVGRLVEDASDEDGSGDKPEVPKLPKGKKLLDVTVSTDVDALYRSVFDAEGTFFEIVCKRCYEELRNFACDRWAVSQESGRPEREISYEITKYIAFSRQVVYVRQAQVLAPYTRKGQIYAIDTVTRNSGIMYSDYFIIHIHFRLTSTMPDKSHMEVVADIEFLKPCLFRGRIESEAWSGMKKYYEVVEKEVQTERDIGAEAATVKAADPTSETNSSKTFKDNYNRTKVASSSVTAQPGPAPFMDTSAPHSWASMATILLVLAILFILTLAMFKMSSALSRLDERITELETLLRQMKRVLSVQQKASKDEL